MSNDKIRTIAVLHVIYCTPCIASTRTLRCTEFLDYICQIRRVLWRIGWHYAKQKHHSITFSSVLYYFISFCYKMIQFLHFQPNFISRTFLSRNFLSFFPPQVHVIPYLHLHCSPQQYYSLFWTPHAIHNVLFLDGLLSHFSCSTEHSTTVLNPNDEPGTQPKYLHYIFYGSGLKHIRYHLFNFLILLALSSSLLLYLWF